MAKGLSASRREKIFAMIDEVFCMDTPAGEDNRVRYLTSAIGAHDPSEPAYILLCMNMAWTLWICPNNSSELEHLCVARVVKAYRNGEIDDEWVDIGRGIGEYLTPLINFYIDNSDKSPKEIEDLFEYARTLCGRGVFCEREWHELRAVYAESKGDFDEAKNHRENFFASPRDENSDCEGCEFDRLIKGCLKRNDMEGALHYIDTIFDRKLKCDSDIPEKARVQHALAAQFAGDDKGQPKKLERLLKKAAKNLYAQKNLIFEAAVFINAALNLGKEVDAVNALEMFRPIVNKHPYEIGSFQFYLSAYFTALKTNNQNDAGIWLDCAQKYASQFDARNRNSYYKDCVEQALTGVRLWTVA